MGKIGWWLRCKIWYCRAFGHRSICLFRFWWKSGARTQGSMTTSWKCERCGETFTKQWDT